MSLITKLLKSKILSLPACFDNVEITCDFVVMQLFVRLS